jgi:hypothetical protein
MVRKPDLALPQAVAGGSVGAVCLQAFVAGLTPRLGPPMLDYVRPLGTLVSTGLGFPASKPWLMGGWVSFLAGGIAWALRCSTRSIETWPYETVLKGPARVVVQGTTEPDLRSAGGVSLDYRSAHNYSFGLQFSPSFSA